MTRLKDMRLSLTSLSGTLPAAIFSPISDELRLEETAVSGTLPPAVSARTP